MKLFLHKEIIMGLIAVGMIGQASAQTPTVKTDQALPAKKQVETSLLPASILNNNKVISNMTDLPLNPNAGSTIESLALMGDPGHTQLVILLPKPVFYTVARDLQQNTLTLTLENVDPDSPLLPVETEGTAVQGIHFDGNDQNEFIVTLSLMPQVTVQSLHWSGTHPARLVLDLGMDPQLPYLNHPALISTPINNGPYQPLIKIPVALTSQQTAMQNYQQALTLVQQQNISAAENALKNILASQADFIPARVTLGKLLLQQNQAKAAINVLTVVPMRNVPSLLQVDYADTLAEAYRQNGQPLQAIPLYNALLTAYPNKSVWWVGLGMCFSALHQISAANEAYRKALALGNLPMVLQQFVNQELQSNIQGG